MIEASPSPTPTQYTATSADSESLPTISSRNSIEDDRSPFPVIRFPGNTPERQGGIDTAPRGLAFKDHVEQEETMDGLVKMEDGLVHDVRGHPGRAQGVQGNTHQHGYENGTGDMHMELGYTDDTPMAANPNGNGTSFFNNLDGMPNVHDQNHSYTQNNPSFLYTQPQAQHRNLFSNGNIGKTSGPYGSPRHSPHRIDVKPLTQYGPSMGEPGPSSSSFAQHRPGSRGTAASSSVSPVMARNNTFRPAPLSQAVPVPASMPPPSPVGLRVGLTDAESDQARSVPGSNRKPRRSAKPRTSIASTSSVGDIGANFAGMGLMSDSSNNNNPVHGNPHLQHRHQQQQHQQQVSAGVGQGIPFPYGMPYSAQTSTMPTPTGSNEEDDSSTKHWKVSCPPPSTLNKYVPIDIN